MSTTEMLRTQLDALQVEHNVVAAENSKLRDANPEGARVADLEQEVAEAQGENVQLAQRVAQLEAALQKAEDETRDREQAVETLTREATELRERREQTEGQLTETEEKLERDRQRAGEVEGYLSRLQQEQEHAQSAAELQTFRTVSAETKKWEEREARLVERIEELKQGTVQGVTGNSGGGAGGGWARSREESRGDREATYGAAVQQRGTAAREELGSPDSAVTEVTGGIEPGREIREQRAGMQARLTPQIKAATTPPLPTSEPVTLEPLPALAAGVTQPSPSRPTPAYTVPSYTSPPPPL